MSAQPLLSESSQKTCCRRSAGGGRICGLGDGDRYASAECPARARVNTKIGECLVRGKAASLGHLRSRYPPFSARLRGCGLGPMGLLSMASHPGALGWTLRP